MLCSIFRISEMSGEGSNRAEEQGEEEWLEGFHLHQTIAAGLEHDIQRVLAATVARFEAIGGPRFDQFVEVWRETGFGLVFQGRESFRELHEFTEELVARAKGLALAEVVGREGKRMFRFAAIYLLYAVYFRQPCRPRVRVRVVLGELEELLTIVESARREGHWDVVYSWCSMVAASALHYTASPTTMGLEVALQGEQRAADQGRVEEDRAEFFTSSPFRGMLEGVVKAHGRYQSMKAGLVAEGDLATSLADPAFPALLEALSKVKKVNGGEVDDVGERRRFLKNRYLTDWELERMNKPMAAEDEMDRDEEEQLPVKGKGKGRGRRGGRGGRNSRGKGRGRAGGLDKKDDPALQSAEEGQRNKGT